MTGLDWTRFADLPGDQAANFELLWRGAVRHTYGRYGTFQARSQQPGVEFHLKLGSDCPLGRAGDWFGWQTKWWPGLQQGRTIGKSRKRDVEDSIDKTKTHLTGLTDWVLCTRRPLAPTDEPWWDALSASAPFKLDHQVAEDLANLLTGDAELFRQTYFGDLVLTPNRLEVLKNLALADLKERWFPEVHQTSSAEMTLRRILAEPGAWGHIEVVGAEITTLTAIIERDVAATPLEASLQADLDALLMTADTIRQLLADAHEHLAPGGDQTWRELGEATVPEAPKPVPPVLRRLRATNHPAALACTNLVFHTREAAALAGSVFGELAVRCVTVTGDAGYGKTQLAAKLASPTAFRPAGVLLFGRQLRSRDDLDDLAQRVSVNGKKVGTFEALLASVDAAAARAQCRLPIIIDGLNEAEDPRDWKPLLERAQVMLEDYPSVLLVCTARADFVDRAIPTSLTNSVNLDGFGEDIDEAVQKYFDHFNIDAGGIDLPFERFDHPIALRIFCSVTNPAREHRVQLIGRAPSLNAMFEGYLADVADRIETLTNSRIRATDVHNALQSLGIELWTTNSREVSETRAKEIFGDTGRRWDESILNALEGEGVLIRQTAQEVDENLATPGDLEPTGRREGLVVTIVYDLLAGHVVASAMAKSSGATFASSLSTPEVGAKFTGEAAHPLAVDIFDALVFVLPRGGLGHLWEHVQQTLLDAALLRTAELAPEDINAATVAAWKQNLPRLSERPGFWPRLRSVRAVPNHPFNATFADKVLRSLSVANRDLTWTEWIRSSTRPYPRPGPGTDARSMEDLRSWIARWRETDDRTEADSLRARWFMWMLTSTVRDLRDAATAALYWFGRGDAASLFELAAGALEINDPYVGERVTAAAYGVTTAHQQPDAEFGNQLGSYLEALVAATAGDAATTPTYHRLIRYYIAGTAEFGRIHYPAVVPAAAADGIEFADGKLSDPLAEGDERRDEVKHTIHMDFGNYTIGRLFDDRANYDYEHEGHRAATDQVLGVIYDLGWRKSEFSSVDDALGRQGRDNAPGRVERYGKKYSWIGLYLMAGMMNARGDRVYGLEVDIDPTFPEVSPALPFSIPSWVRSTPTDDRIWLIEGIVKVPDDFMYAQTLAGVDGPWVLVHAEIDAKDERTGRGGYGLFNTIAISPGDPEVFMQCWKAEGHPGRDLIELPKAYYLFAGEIPWHKRMVTSGDDIAGTGMLPIERDEDDGWRDPYDREDPYIDHIRMDLSATDGVRADEGEPSDERPDFPFNTPEESVDEVKEIDVSAAIEAKTAGHLATIPPYLTLEFESLAHVFAWEGYHSSENQAFAYVPSRRLSQHAGLRSVAAGFDQVDAAGRPASMSFTAPQGFNGHLLYIREDVVKAYAGQRTVVTFGWGERQIHTAWPENVPDRLLEVYRAYRNIWRTHRVVAAGQQEAASGRQDAGGQAE